MRCRRLGLEGRQCGLVGCYDGVRGSGRLAREELLGPTHRWWQGSGPGRGELLHVGPVRRGDLGHCLDIGGEQTVRQRTHRTDRADGPNADGSMG